MDFNKIFPNNLFHSYVIEGNPDEVAPLLRLFLEDSGYVNKQSPDVLLGLYDSLSIEDSQNVKEWYQNKPTDGKKKVCILGAKFINREAEQSLLKIIEEPTPDTHFFIIVPDSSLLLGTILSRVHVLKNISGKSDDNVALEFTKMSQVERIEKVAEIIKEFKDSEGSGGLRHNAIVLINGIERIIYENWKKDVNNENLKFILEELKKSRGYLSKPGASVKMILEHIALVV